MRKLMSRCWFLGFCRYSHSIHNHIWRELLFNITWHNLIYVMARIGDSAQQCSPKVHLLLCLPKSWKLKSLQHHIKPGLENPRCFCLPYMTRRAVPHRDHSLCEKIPANISAEFILCQFPCIAHNLFSPNIQLTILVRVFYTGQPLV